MPQRDVDLRVGGRIRYVWRHADGHEMGMRGGYHEITPPARLVHAELFDGYWTGGEMTVTTTLAEQAGRTTLAISVICASREIRDVVLRSPMKEGVASSFDQLAELLAASMV
jgi:uncharacterized protein YndB with AHSA1/START domain